MVLTAAEMTITGARVLFVPIVQEIATTPSSIVLQIKPRLALVGPILTRMKIYAAPSAWIINGRLAYPN